MRRPRLGALCAALCAVAAAATLLLPWWRSGVDPVLLVGPTRALGADTRAGWEVLGPLPTVLVLTLALATAVATVIGAPTAARVATAATGAAAATAAAVTLARWGATPAPGLWTALLLGLGAAVLGLGLGPAGVSRRGVAVVAVVLSALAVPVLPTGADRPDPVRAGGPFERLGGLGATTFRSGEVGLPASLLTVGLVDVGGVPAAATDDGLVRLDADGRAQVLGRIPADDPGRRRGGVIGTAGGRVVRWTGVGTLAVTGLAAGDPLDVVVSGVATEDVSPVGADGSLWLRAAGDPAGTFRRLDLAGLDGRRDVDAGDLPAALTGAAADVRASDLRPVRGAALRMVLRDGGYRLERLAPSGVSVVAGGPDPACGITGPARAAHLPSVGPLAVDADGGVWFTVSSSAAVPGRLVRLGVDGVLKVVPDPLPGPVYAMAAASDRSIHLVMRSAPAGLWRLPDAASRLTDLPPTPPGCVASPPPVGPRVGLTRVAAVGATALGTLLGVDGRFAAAERGATAEIVAVSPDGSRVPLGVRRDGNLGQVWPDGTGGIWWLEAPSGNRLTLVHGRAGRPEQRYAAVAHPAPGEGSALVPDLGGRPPLLATAAGAYRITDGRAERVLAGRIDGGVVRADGRGWIVADGRLVALTGDRVLGPVIDAGDRRGETDTPAAVQLAHGVRPDALTLPDPSVALDANGRAIVVSGGVALAVRDDGTVTVVAQDPRLDVVTAVEGGLAVYDAASRAQLRVELPG